MRTGQRSISLTGDERRPRRRVIVDIERPATRVPTVLVAVTMAAGLTGCGGSTAAVAAAKTPSVARPGAAFATGQPATVAFTVQSSSGATVGTSRLEVTVVSIQKGSLSDFNGIQLDANEKASTPDYVRVKLTNLGPLPLNTNDEDDPAFAINGVDSTGQTQQSVTFIGSFPRCPDADTPKPLARGNSFQTCLTFLVPGGISKVAWTGTERYDETPVTWGAK
jgi:hypothetical protein